MSGNAPTVPEGPNPENNHIGVGPLINPNRIRNNNNQNPLFNVRDRLFHTLFYRAALAYARTFPKPLRRFIEFLVLIKAIAAFFVLVYIHTAFSRTPSTCLQHVKETWPRDGILRVEIVRNAGNDYNIEQSYAKEEKLKQQGKVDDFAHLIGLLAREGFNLESSIAEDSTKETHPLDSNPRSYGNGSSPELTTMLSKLFPHTLTNVTKVSPAVWKRLDMLIKNPFAEAEKPIFSGHNVDNIESSVLNITEETNVKVPDDSNEDNRIIEMSKLKGELIIEKPVNSLMD